MDTLKYLLYSAFALGVGIVFWTFRSKSVSPPEKKSQHAQNTSDKSHDPGEVNREIRTENAKTPTSVTTATSVPTNANTTTLTTTISTTVSSPKFSKVTFIYNPSNQNLLSFLVKHFVNGISLNFIEIRADNNVNQPELRFQPTGDILSGDSIIASYFARISSSNLLGENAAEETLVQLWLHKATAASLSDNILTELNDRLNSREYFVGKGFTIADLAVWLLLEHKFKTGDRTKFANLDRFSKMCNGDNRFTSFKQSIAKNSRTVNPKTKSDGISQTNPVKSTKTTTTTNTTLTTTTTTTNTKSSSLSSIESRIQDLNKRQDQILSQSRELQLRLKKLVFNEKSEGEKLVIKSCKEIGLKLFYLRQTPSDYYNWKLEQRRAYLNAHSIHHLCKLLIIENKECKSSLSDPLYSQFYCVVIQYSTSYKSHNLKEFLQEIYGNKLSKNQYNLQFADEKSAIALTGFQHNGMCPIGMSQKVPVILSDRILELTPKYMWLGGGHKDVKLCVDVDEFVAKCNPFVANITAPGYNTEEI